MMEVQLPSTRACQTWRTYCAIPTLENAHLIAFVTLRIISVSCSTAVYLWRQMA